MTDVEFENLCRMWLNDYDKDFWTSQDFAIMKSTAIHNLHNKWWLFLQELQRDWDIIDVLPNVRQYPLPLNAAKIIRIEVAETGDKIHYVWQNQVYYYTKMNNAWPTNWTFKGGQIYLFPNSASLLPGYLRIWYYPKSTGVLADLPPVLHPVAAMEVVAMARQKDEHLDQTVLLTLQRYEDAARQFLVQAQAQDPYVSVLQDIQETIDDI